MMNIVPRYVFPELIVYIFMQCTAYLPIEFSNCLMNESELS